MGKAEVERILIGVPSIGQVDARFLATLFQLSKLSGTDLMTVRRSMPDKARNGLARLALKNHYPYIFFLDDDMIVEDRHAAELLDRLLGRMKEDPTLMIVAPRAYKRTRPFHPCVFRKRPDAAYDPVEEIGKGLVEVDAIHCAATLVRLEVFQKLSDPWFEFSAADGEDIVFTRKAKTAGQKIACDTDLEIGHLSEPTIVTSEIYEGWKQAQAPKLAVPTAKDLAEIKQTKA